MNIYFDTEFDDQPGNLRLIALGAVREDGQEFYMENAQVDPFTVNQWVYDNVIPHLTGPANTPLIIAQKFAEFCGPNPQFWGWYGCYDWYLVVQLYGGFMKVPQWWPQYYNEINTLANLFRKYYPPKQEGVAHNALEDARHHKRIYDYVMREV